MLQYNKYTSILKGIGFSTNDSHIYISLLDNGISNISNISNYTGLHRMQIYRLLPKLIELGFILKTSKGKRNFYYPCSPNKINEEYNKIFNNNKSLIDEMNYKYSNLDKKTSVILNKGRKGIHFMYNDILNSLNKGEVFYRITSESDVDKINNIFIPKDYKKKRDEKEIERYIIMTRKTANKKKPKLERDIRIIEENTIEFKDNIIFTIYKNKLSLIDFNTETSILIESSDFAEFMKKIFKLLFNKL